MVQTSDGGTELGVVVVDALAAAGVAVMMAAEPHLPMTMYGWQRDVNIWVPATRKDC